MRTTARHPEIESRMRWRIAGQVQGVGFRPFVHRIATAHHLHGFVRNDGDGVTIEAQGSPADLDAFAIDLRDRPPALAVIRSAANEPIAPAEGEAGFEIVPSAKDNRAPAHVTVDTATCPDCVRELLDPRDRRHGYALTNCTHCGPRYTILRDIPYDRPNTTMAAFVMCEACAGEYADPTDRRFHAQPTACHDCGPRLSLIDRHGRAIPGDPIRGAADLLATGSIVAVKGIGGFHLAARADRDGVVSELRRRKRRDRKPFAVMVRDIDTARGLVQLTPAAETLMTGPRCPIVLAPRLTDAGVCDAVAPGSHRLGVMLPYTPVHHLLFACSQPRLGPLVMTSGNVSDEPLAIDNDEAVARLGGLCDAFLIHDRPIERAVDDSVYLVAPDAPPLPMRRARGEAPAVIELPVEAPTPGLCVGGELKNTVAIVQDGHAILSPHVGDLKHPLALANFQQTIDDLLRLYDVRPAWIARDLHPMYLSSQHAERLSAAWRVSSLAVQHHHAHAAALLAEHRLTGPILALTCDGVGYGERGEIWGGELLAADLHGYQRLAHQRPLRLAGGDAAARDVRRCGLALLYEALGDDFADHPAARALYPERTEREMLCWMIGGDVRCVSSSATGRLFDGAAALLGVCEYNTFEAEAAMALEACAAQWTGDAPRKLPSLYDPRRRVVEVSPLVSELLSDRPAPERAARFHACLAQGWAEAVVHAASHTGLDTIGLTGGAFANERLTRLLRDRLQRAGLRVLVHERVPANDGGLALGQAAIAAARLRRERK